LYVFFIGCIATVISSVFSDFFIGRIILALSGALLIVPCLVVAPSLAGDQYGAGPLELSPWGERFTSLGVPFGLIIGNTFGCIFMLSLIPSLL
jgi:MFS transporter, DHA1 family, purine base/nucleoside efflux pump